MIPAELVNRILDLSPLIILVLVVVLVLLYYSKEARKLVGVSSEFDKLLKEVTAIARELEEVEDRLSNAEAIIEGKNEEVEKVAEKRRAVTLAEASFKLDFSIRDVFTPKIMMTQEKIIIDTAESTHFKRRFKKVLYVETDAPAMLSLTLNGDLDKFVDLKVFIYNKKKKLGLELSKNKRTGIIPVNMIGKMNLDIEVEGIPKRTDTDIQASIILNAKMQTIS